MQLEQTPIFRLLQGLSPDEVREFIDIVDYLGEKAGPSNPSGHLPEGSIASLLNKSSPNVRDRLRLLTDTLQTPRSMPFTDKLSEGQVADAFGLDPDAATTTLAALDMGDVIHGVQKKLGGTDADRPQEPLTMRDEIEAAMAAHGGN